MESWNSANGFIFFGKSGEIVSNRMEDQEMRILLDPCWADRRIRFEPRMAA